MGVWLEYGPTHNKDDDIDLPSSPGASYYSYQSWSRSHAPGSTLFYGTADWYTHNVPIISPYSYIWNVFNHLINYHKPIFKNINREKITILKYQSFRKIVETKKNMYQ